MSDQLIPDSPEERKRVLSGILFLGIAVACGWFFIYHPVHEAMQTGTIVYSLKGIVLAPMSLYLALIIFFVPLKEGDVRSIDANGKKKYTRKGWLLIGGALVFMGLTLAGWVWYLHRLGFHDVL